MTPETLQRAPSRRRRSCRRRSGGEIQDSEESQRTEEAVIAFAAREDDDDKAKPSTTSFVDGKDATASELPETASSPAPNSDTALFNCARHFPEFEMSESAFLVPISKWFSSLTLPFLCPDKSAFSKTDSTPAPVS
ncbi:uncharacterized protein HKW66_Vig0143010 [Vigna angularis]|uniref:Uncharacterized protein n=1 Tax=Phaseolus angularis TaxID=3914 RepID=A0A8T0KG94_PHAAN|nr:uncharacterized protein HKW66_Vig0143010 [Vigna angularis]